MFNYKKLFLAACAFFMAAGAANAQERWPKWYVGLEGSLPFVGNSGVTQGGASMGTVEFDNPGWGVGASLGYMPGGTGSFLDAMRFEVEVFYRENDLDTLAGASIADDISSVAYMVNAFYDFETGTQFSPYIGAGAGIAENELNVPSSGVSDTDAVFAYQGMLGVAYQPQSIPNTAFSLGYRYFATADNEYGSSGGTVEHEYDSHSAEIGARFAF